MTANPPDYNYEPNYHIRWYKLKYRKPVPCSCEEANELIGSRDVRVRCTYMSTYWVSTVFLCLDHGCDPTHPLLFETMAFNTNFEELECLRAHTWREALNNHWKIVDVVKDEYNTKR